MQSCRTVTISSYIIYQVGPSHACWLAEKFHDCSVLIIMVLFYLVYTGFICSLTLHILKALWLGHIQYTVLFKSTFPWFKCVICHSYRVTAFLTVSQSLMSTAGRCFHRLIRNQWKINYRSRVTNMESLFWSKLSRTYRDGKDGGQLLKLNISE